jgi:glutathione reductase (NADPH)
VPSIYAIGDVTNRVNLTPVAIREGMAFVETVFKDNPTPVDHELIPSAVFTQPELGTIGLTEEEAREQEPIDVYCASFRPMRGSFAGKPDRVLMKLIVSK